ncbi:MAG: copper resistance system multicopper oxidase [Methylomicrobium sp.]
MPAIRLEQVLTIVTLPLVFLLAPKESALAGTYHLTISEQKIDLVGTEQSAILADASLPAPTLHWRQGEIVTLEVENRLHEPTSLHWHGIVLPYEMDGVPGISFAGIAPGETFTYRFPVQQSGTYWYHGHSGLQEQQGLYGALIIDPPEPTYPVDRDIVILLSDWPEADPYRTLARLKKQSDYYNFQKRTIWDFFDDIGRLGFIETIADRIAWGDMRMDPTDIADVTGATYHFLINGQPSDTNWTALFKPGEKIRLRFINASAMTHFDVSIPQLKMRVIEADGQAVQAIDVDELPIAVAETYDVIVEPEAGRAYTIFAEAMDRSGYARAILTSDPTLHAPLPPLRKLKPLTLAEMGPSHGEHRRHNAPQAAQAEDHTGHRTAAPTMSDDAMHHHGHAGHIMTPRIESTGTLHYRNLKSIHPNPHWRTPDREITLRLTGNMYRYIWSFDDKKYADAEPIEVRFGEVVRFTYINETMMNHPMHLHGLWQYLDNGNGAYNPKKHVVNVKPGETLSVDVPIDATGDWAFHCHLLYHMGTGMFRQLSIEDTEPQ